MMLFYLTNHENEYETEVFKDYSWGKRINSMKENLHNMGRENDRVGHLEKELKSEIDPEKMLRLIFEFINFKRANTDIYFMLNNSKRPMTVNDLCKELPYSERTLRTYLGMLTDKQYVKKVPCIRDRPCFAYKTIPPSEVWGLMVEEMRRIKREASKSLGEF